MEKNFKNFVNEIYVGTNKKLGFQYSTPDYEYSISGMIYSNLRIRNLEEYVINELDKNIKDYLFDIEIIKDVKNAKIYDEDKEVDYKYKYAYFYNLDFDAYSQLEIISLYHYFDKNLDKTILNFPLKSVYLNDKKLIDLQIYKKNKIGF